MAAGTATGSVTQEARLLGCLAVAAASPGYAAAYTYSTPYPYSTPHAVESPPAQAASCASTTAATAKAEADPATSATASIAELGADLLAVYRYDFQAREAQRSQVELWRS